MKYDQKLKDFACQHVKDQGPTGKVGHDGAVGENWMQRVGGLLQQNLVHGENIAYGEEDAKTAIMELAIDDGVSKRSHRDNLFRVNYNQIGVCAGPHKKWKQMSVVLFSGPAGKNEKTH